VAVLNTDYFARAFYPGKFGFRYPMKIEALCKYAAVPDEDLHAAGNDACTTAIILVRMFVVAIQLAGLTDGFGRKERPLWSVVAALGNLYVRNKPGPPPQASMPTSPTDPDQAPIKMEDLADRLEVQLTPLPGIKMPPEMRLD
jgi:hypothetical protein